ncbi:MAG: dihydroorotate dehydrogenase electron transfer subunit [Oscillospiraceae bacterium]|nr:dihydroorotate dehydrogenase electron transfer subunit [Oscillospiraceae bacterium]
MEKYTQGMYPVIRKQTLAREIYDYTVYCPEIAQAAVCGQFVDIAAKGHLLRRPISLCGIDREKGTIRIVFEVRGEGTAEIARINEGDMIDIIAPLGGHGFDLLDKSRKAVAVGGGIGTPPLVPIAQHYGKNITVISGFRSANAVILQDDFKAVGAETILCTDDGTAGRKGFVTDALAELLEREKPDIIYACGPMVMMKKVAEAAQAHDVRCQVSLEERMGCGVGACLVCACRIKLDGGERYAHVCKDGPVFDSREVIFQ